MRAVRRGWLVGALAAVAAIVAVLAVACSGATTGTTADAGSRAGAAQPAGPTDAVSGSRANGGAGAAATDGSGGSATTPGPVPAGLVDPCSLLSTSAATKIADGSVLDGTRDPEEDGAYVQCTWRNDHAYLAGEWDFAPPIAVFLTPTTPEVKANLEAAIGSGNMDVLSGTAADRAAVTSADLGTAGVGGASGTKGSIFFRITCWSPQVPAGSAKKPSKQICEDAAKAVAAALP